MTERPPESELLDALREGPGLPDDVKGAIWRRVESAVQAPGGTGGDGDPGSETGPDADPGLGEGDAPSGPSDGGAGGTEIAETIAREASSMVSRKLATLLSLGSLAVGALGGGVATYVAVHEEAPAPEVVVVEAPVEPPSDLPAPTEPVAPPPVPVEPSVTSAADAVDTDEDGADVNGADVDETPRRTAAARRLAAEDPVTDRAAERALLRQAQAALGRGRPDDALSALDAHRDSHPRSPLAEERMALRVRALEAAGRAEEAADERARFLRRHPTSIFRELVEPRR